MIKILGIETSCDETSVAIVSEDKTILANETFSQINEHKKYGGVVPEIASRSHLNYLETLLKLVPEKCGIALNEVDAIAVTAGPGLIGGVMVGVMYAKALAAALEKPIIAVHHLEGHALTVRLTDEVEYPFLLLLVSGGHTQFLIVKDLGEYEKIGTTLDDAVGEAFDKVSKMLKLGYPGGPEIERRATQGDKRKYKFPMPMCNIDGCDLSFSGLKTAVKRTVDSLINISDHDIADICASFQYTIGEVLKFKLNKAIEKYISVSNVRAFVLAGGVAANQYIRTELKQICDQNQFVFYAPPLELCGDNAAMIAWAGIERYKKGMIDDLSFAPYSRRAL